MNKRLQTILDIEHITAAQLADSLGIQRGGISHLLSGRNKPSFDFLEKILRKYPEINAEWLITGNGKPIRTNSESNGTSTGSNSFDKANYMNDFQDNTKEFDLFGNSMLNTPVIPVAQQMPPAVPITSTVSNEDNSPASPLPDKFPDKTPEKKPVRVIIYFSDGTYSEFYPFSVPSR